MAHPNGQIGQEYPGVEVLTLLEASEFLRTSEAEVLKLVESGTILAQRIGGEWRFWKRALIAFLLYGPLLPHRFGTMPSPYELEYPNYEEKLLALEQRILSKFLSAEQQTAKPGSKQAVLRHFGVFKEDADLDEQLADLRVRREAAAE